MTFPGEIPTTDDAIVPAVLEAPAVAALAIVTEVVLDAVTANVPLVKPVNVNPAVTIFVPTGIATDIALVNVNVIDEPFATALAAVTGKFVAVTFNVVPLIVPVKNDLTADVTVVDPDVNNKVPIPG